MRELCERMLLPSRVIERLGVARLETFPITMRSTRGARESRCRLRSQLAALSPRESPSRGVVDAQCRVLGPKCPFATGWALVV